MLLSEIKIGGKKKLCYIFYRQECAERIQKEEGKRIIRYVVKRLLQMILVLLGMTFVVYMLLSIAPGDAAMVRLSADATPEEVEAYREELGLNDPVLVRYGHYMYNLLLKGDMGSSYVSEKSVSEQLMDKFPVTAKFAVITTVVMLIIAIPLGVASALYHRSWIDNICSAVAVFGVSMPSFWFGMVLIIVFSVHLGWFPSVGFDSPKAMVLPAITLGFCSAATIMRTTRSSMLDTIRQDYIRTARAKGQKESVIVRHHMLRNALIPIITAAAIQIGYLLGGTMVVEQVFTIPGMGRMMVESMKGRDYPMVLGGLLVISTGFCMMNLLSDILYAWVDPRVRAQYAGRRKSSGLLSKIRRK